MGVSSLHCGCQHQGSQKHNAWQFFCHGHFPLIRKII
jgi:hypothetical protein